MMITPLHKGYYESYGSEWSTTERRRAEYTATLYKVLNICSLLEDLKAKRILDYGCGLGDALHMLAKHLQASDAIGVDVSSTMIATAKQEYPMCTFLQGGIEEVKNLKVDLITFIDVLEHLSDIPPVLEVARKSALYVAIKIPLEKTWLISLLNALRLKEPKSRLYCSEGHLYEFRRREVERLLEEAGLQIIKRKTTFPPKCILFSEFNSHRMKSKVGRLARLKYLAFRGMKHLPYGVTRYAFQVVNGVDLFVLCKT